MNDDGVPELADKTDADGDPTAHGIVQCLRMLVDEAASLRLPRTLAALRAAMSICAREGDTGEIVVLADDFALPTPGMLLH